MVEGINLNNRPFMIDPFNSWDDEGPAVGNTQIPPKQDVPPPVNVPVIAPPDAPVIANSPNVASTEVAAVNPVVMNTSQPPSQLAGFVITSRHLSGLRQMQDSTGYFDRGYEWSGEWNKKGALADSGDKKKLDHEKTTTFLNNTSVKEPIIGQNIANVWISFNGQELDPGYTFSEYSPADQWNVVYDHYADTYVQQNGSLPSNQALFKDLSRLNSMLSNPISSNIIGSDFSTLDLAKLLDALIALKATATGRDKEIIEQMLMILYVLIVRHLMALREMQYSDQFSPEYVEDGDTWPKEWLTKGAFAKDGDPKVLDEAKLRAFLTSINVTDKVVHERVIKLWHSLDGKELDPGYVFAEYSPADHWNEVYDYYAALLKKCDDALPSTEELYNRTEISVSSDQAIFNEREFQVDLRFICAVYNSMGIPLGDPDSLTYNDVVQGATPIAILARLLIKGRKGEEGGITPEDVKQLARAVSEDKHVYGGRFDSLGYDKNPISAKDVLTSVINAEPNILDPKPPVKLDRNIYIGMGVMKKLDAAGVEINPGAMVLLSRGVSPNIHYGKGKGTAGMPNANSYLFAEYNYGMTGMNKDFDNRIIEDVNNDGSTFRVGAHLEGQGTTGFAGDILGEHLNYYVDMDAAQHSGGYAGEGSSFGVSGGAYGMSRWIRYDVNMGGRYSEFDNPSFMTPSGWIVHGTGRITAPLGLVNPWYEQKAWWGESDVGLPRRIYQGESVSSVGMDIYVPVGKQDWLITPHYIIPDLSRYTRERKTSFDPEGDIGSNPGSRIDQMMSSEISGWGVKVESPEYKVPRLGGTKFFGGYNEKQINGWDPSVEYNAGVVTGGGQYRFDYFHRENPSPFTMPYDEDILRFTYHIDPSGRTGRYSGGATPASVFVEGGQRRYDGGQTGNRVGLGLRFELGRAGKPRIIGDPREDAVYRMRAENEGIKDKENVAHKGDAAGEPVEQTQWFIIYGAGSRDSDDFWGRAKADRRRAAAKEKLLTSNELRSVETRRGVAGINTLQETQKYAVARFLEAEGYEVRDEYGRIDNKKLRKAVSEYALEHAGRKERKVLSSENKYIESIGHNIYGTIDKKVIRAINKEISSTERQDVQLPENLLGAAADTSLAGMRPDMALTQETITIVRQDNLRTRIVTDQGIKLQPSGMSANDPVGTVINYVYHEVGLIHDVKIEFSGLGTPTVSGKIEWKDPTLKSDAEARFNSNVSGLDFETQLITEIEAGIIGYATMAALEVLAERAGQDVNSYAAGIVSNRPARPTPVQRPVITPAPEVAPSEPTEVEDQEESVTPVDVIIPSPSAPVTDPETTPQDPVTVQHAPVPVVVGEKKITVRNRTFDLRIKQKPDGGHYVEYAVKQGDNLSTITLAIRILCGQMGVEPVQGNYTAVAGRNNITDPHLIYPRQIIVVDIE